MALPLMPGLQGLRRQQEPVPTNGLWSDLRGEEGSADEEEAELHAPTTQEMLQYELMRMTLDPEYSPKHSDFYEYRELVLTAIKQKSGWQLQYASEEIKKDREVVLAAVKKNGYALTYASDELKKDREFILAAVKQDRHALGYASEELQNDPEIRAAAGWV